MANARVSIRNYVIVTAAYWAFTLTDGALRMLVLLHFHALGYSPFQLATLFLLYEALGAVTNLLGGAIASRTGLEAILVAGLVLQVGALCMLSALSTTWLVSTQVVFVLVAQGASGVAKDLTKLSAKSTIKLVAPTTDHGSLFRWVALLTGSKNALKGAGFFAGGALLSWLGFESSLWAMATLVGIAGLGTLVSLPADLGRAKTKPRQGLLSKSREVNVLSGARVFLFGARDVWFVVALPVFLHQTLGFGFTEVSGYMAAWVIGYGVVQAAAPKLQRHGPGRDDARSTRRWVLALAMIPLLMVGALNAGASPGGTIFVGLGVFGVLFAVSSALHSYLILAYADADEVAASVGFYYMANAIGRLAGTLLSGLTYQLAGLEASLLTASAMLLVSAGLSRWLPDPQGMRTPNPPR